MRRIFVHAVINVRELRPLHPLVFILIRAYTFTDCKSDWRGRPTQKKTKVVTIFWNFDGIASLRLLNSVWLKKKWRDPLEDTKILGHNSVLEHFNPPFESDFPCIIVPRMLHCSSRQALRHFGKFTTPHFLHFHFYFCKLHLSLQMFKACVFKTKHLSQSPLFGRIFL